MDTIPATADAAGWLYIVMAALVAAAFAAHLIWGFVCPLSRTRRKARALVRRGGDDLMPDFRALVRGGDHRELEWFVMIMLSKRKDVAGTRYPVLSHALRRRVEGIIWLGDGRRLLVRIRKFPLGWNAHEVGDFSRTCRKEGCPGLFLHMQQTGGEEVPANIAAFDLEDSARLVLDETSTMIDLAAVVDGIQEKDKEGR